MKYKNIITRFCGMAICLVLGTTSCQNWLDVSPESEVKYDDLFSTKNGFKDQLTGVYTKMCDEGLYGAHLTYGMYVPNKLVTITISGVSNTRTLHVKALWQTSGHRCTTPLLTPTYY